jgi:formate dehydrogenase major subunit
MKHPGTPNLYDTSKPVAEGGLGFRARFGVERDGENLLAEGSPIRSVRKFRMAIRNSPSAMLMKLGWDGDLTDDERCHRWPSEVAGPKTNWKTDLSGGIQRVAIKHGCAPFGNAKARAVVWTFPDPVPLHREPLYTNRRDLRGGVSDLRGPQDLLPAADALCVDPEERLLQGLPDHPDLRPSGRIRGRRRRDPVQPVACRTAAGHVRRDQSARCQQSRHPRRRDGLGRRPGRRQGQGHGHGDRARRPGVAFMPFHFGGHFQGEDQRRKYPKGADPYVLGEACNTAQTYGYDSVTQMQETKATLCKIERA